LSVRSHDLALLEERVQVCHLVLSVFHKGQLLECSLLLGIFDFVRVLNVVAQGSVLVHPSEHFSLEVGLDDQVRILCHVKTDKVVKEW